MTAAARTYPVTGTGTVVSTQCYYRGLTIASTAGADVVVYDGTSAAGTILAQFTLAAKGDKHIDVVGGAMCSTGIHLTATAAIQGHVRVS